MVYIFLWYEWCYIIKWIFPNFFLQVSDYYFTCYLLFDLGNNLHFWCGWRQLRREKGVNWFKRSIIHNSILHGHAQWFSCLTFQKVKLKSLYKIILLIRFTYDISNHSFSPWNNSCKMKQYIFCSLRYIWYILVKIDDSDFHSMGGIV